MGQLQQRKVLTIPNAIKAAGRDAITAKTNDEKLLAMTRQWFALDMTVNDTMTDAEVNEVQDRQEKIAHAIAKTPADTMKGAAVKLLWLDQEGNRDTQEGFSPHDVYMSVLADTRRIASLRNAN